MAATDLEGLMRKLASIMEGHGQAARQVHLQDLRRYLVGNREIQSVERQALRDPSMSSWLLRWGAAISDADEILDKSFSWQRKARTSSKVLRPFLYPIASHLDNIQQNCQKIKKNLAGLISEVKDKRNPLGDQDSYNPKSTWISTSLLSGKVFGRVTDKQKIINRIIRSDGSPFVISITGVTGVGKTTLAQEVFNDDVVVDHFRDLRIWINFPSVSFEPFTVITNTYESITRKEYKHSSNWRDIVHHELQGRRYLLVFDHFVDVKEHFWGMTMHPFEDSSTGSVIIVTTQEDNFAPEIAKCEQYELQPLLRNDSLKLFTEIILKPGEGSLPSDLNKIGEKIVETCSGIPFALKYLGLTLRFQRECNRWQHILNDLESGYTTFNLVLDSNFYGGLPLYLKQCFMYCALFPKNHIFNREYMTDLWMVEHFVPIPSDEESDLGPSNYYTRMFDNSFRCITEYSPEPLYEMYPLKHSLAMRIPKEFHRVVKIGQPVTIPKECRYLSLISDSTTSLFPHELDEANKLITLILLREEQMVQLNKKCIIREIPPKLCEDHKDLCALDLQFSLISELPITIVGLNNLRYLNLSQTEIEMVPELVGRLVSLEMLILSHCEKLIKIHNSITNLTRLKKLNLECCYFLAELPEGLSNIKSLRYLSILECSSLKQMSARIGELTNLETLSTYIASTDNGYTLSELKNLNNLSGKLCLENLEKVKNDDAKEAKLGEKPKLESLTLLWRDEADSEKAKEAKLGEKPKLESLTLLWRGEADSEKVMESLQPNQNLKQLEVTAYPGKQFPKWILGPYLDNLVEIKLINLKKIERLPPLGQLPRLEIIEIIGMESVTSVDEGFFGENGIFPSLKKLTFSYMPKLKEWTSLGKQIRFNCLVELRLIHCPKLRVLHMVLPSVKRLIMWMDNLLLLDGKGSLAGLNKSLECVSISLCGELSKSSQLGALHMLKGLKKLEISCCEELETVPEGVQFLTHLERLTISSCSNLVYLPDWLHNLSSITFLKVSGCPMLRLIPPGLLSRSNLQFIFEA